VESERVQFAVAMLAPHHLAKPELQAKILEMLKRGISQNEIAAKLNKSLGTVSYHVARLREAGQWKVEAREYQTPEPIVKGKRKCVECGRSKTLGAFPTPRVAVCSVCRRRARRLQAG
jgi:DNA-binding transcriptional ArsR family regulator